MNKNILTIVVPDEDFSHLIIILKMWFSEPHFVAMNYQTTDDNLNTYQNFFENVLD